MGCSPLNGSSQCKCNGSSIKFSFQIANRVLTGTLLSKLKAVLKGGVSARVVPPNLGRYSHFA